MYVCICKCAYTFVYMLYALYIHMCICTSCVCICALYVRLCICTSCIYAFLCCACVLYMYVYVFCMYVCVYCICMCTFQMRCLRDILGLTLWDRRYNADVLEECGEATMRDQLRLKRLQWFGHLMRMPIHRPQRQILKCRPQGKRRPPGGTPLRWIDVVHKDLASLCNWHQMVNDRTTWRAFIHHSLDGNHTTS